CGTTQQHVYFSWCRFPQSGLNYSFSGDDVPVHGNEGSCCPGSSFVFASIHKCIPTSSLFIRRRCDPRSIRQHDRLAAHWTSTSAITAHALLSPRPRIALVIGNPVPGFPFTSSLAYFEEQAESPTWRIKQLRIPVWMLANLGYLHGHRPIVGRALRNPDPDIVMLLLSAAEPGYDKLTVARSHNSRGMALRKWFFITSDEASEKHIDTFVSR